MQNQKSFLDNTCGCLSLPRMTAQESDAKCGRKLECDHHSDRKRYMIICYRTVCATFFPVCFIYFSFYNIVVFTEKCFTHCY